VKLKGKVAIITGSGSGLGRASALLFAKEGAKVVVADIAAKGAEETVSIIKKAGGDAIPCRVDVTKASDCEKMVATAINEYGKLDIMFNNAGAGGAGEKIVDLAEEEWNRVMSINLTGVFLGTKYAVREMLKGKSGVIINISSPAALLPAKGGVYGIAKAGVIHLTKMTALEYGRDNIRANCIVPGPMDTAFFDHMAPGDRKMSEAVKNFSIKHVLLGRLADPNEVAKVALFLASDDASFVTGAVWSADGGYSLL
jgi:NAD(P)-dependent dehydrogenase (short-subunit alcohol dehydrogenase family)